MKIKYNYIKILEDGRLWRCFDKLNDKNVGIIEWMNCWDQFCFYSNKSYPLNANCLKDISDFIKLLEEKK